MSIGSFAQGKQKMRSDKSVMLEQASSIRARAAYYRQLARTLTTRSSASVLKSANDLEQRAVEIELYAKHHGSNNAQSPTAVRGPRDGLAAPGRNVINALQRGLDAAIADWKHWAQAENRAPGGYGDS